MRLSPPAYSFSYAFGLTEPITECPLLSCVQTANAGNDILQIDITKCHETLDRPWFKPLRLCQLDQENTIFRCIRFSLV